MQVLRYVLEDVTPVRPADEVVEHVGVRLPVHTTVRQLRIARQEKDSKERHHLIRIDFPVSVVVLSCVQLRLAYDQVQELVVQKQPEIVVC